MNAKTKQRKNQVNPANIFEREEMTKKTDAILQGLQAYTWHDLETHGKFDKNAKLSFISDDMLIVGCDIGSDTHYMRAIDSPEFKELHLYYTTRAESPLKKMQSLIVIACKILRIIFTILRDGAKYDPGRMLGDIRRQGKQTASAAA